MNYKIISKFIKDISFEIPNAKTFVMLEKEISKYSLNFDIKSKPFKENIIEVNTILSLVPNQEVKHKILTEINMTSLISVEKKFEEVTPSEFMCHAHHWLILLGRYVCKARKPDCPNCMVNELCSFKAKTTLEI